MNIFKLGKNNFSTTGYIFFELASGDVTGGTEANK